MNLPITKEIVDRYINFIGLEDVHKASSNHYYAKCPYCKQKGLSTRDRKFYILTTKGVNVYCHRCGVRKSFANFLSDFYPSMLESIKGEIYLGKKVESELILEPVKPKEIIKATPEILKSLLRISGNKDAEDYCRSRKFPSMVFNEFYYCENYRKFLFENHLIEKEPFKSKDKRIVIPYYDDKGQLTHIQGRAIDKSDKFRYMTITLIENTPKIWGLDKINKNTNIKICEGVFDAIFVNNSLAVGSAFTDLKFLMEKGIELKNVTFCFDHDIETNPQLKIAADKYLSMGAKLFFWEKFKNYKIKDFNDYILEGNSIEALNKMIDNNSYAGLVAKVRLKMV